MRSADWFLTYGYAAILIITGAVAAVVIASTAYQVVQLFVGLRVDP